MRAERPLTEKEANAIDSDMNNTAITAVIFWSGVDFPREPKRVWAEPPKAAPMPEPLPVCSNTTSIKKIDTKTCIITNNVYIVRTPSGLAAVLDDPDKTCGLKTCAAYQSAINVSFVHQLFYIGRLDTAAILNPNRVRHR